MAAIISLKSKIEILTDEIGRDPFSPTQLQLWTYPFSADKAKDDKKVHWVLRYMERVKECIRRY